MCEDMKVRLSPMCCSSLRFDYLKTLNSSELSLVFWDYPQLTTVCSEMEQKDPWQFCYNPVLSGQHTSNKQPRMAEWGTRVNAAKQTLTYF